MQKKTGKLIHNANSNLAVIYGYLQLLEKSLSDKEKEEKWVKEMLKAYKNLQEIINQIEKSNPNQ
jgi:hypothetical protein